jgi:hypothetical protein
MSDFLERGIKKCGATLGDIGGETWGLYILSSGRIRAKLYFGRYNWDTVAEPLSFRLFVGGSGRREGYVHVQFTPGRRRVDIPEERTSFFMYLIPYLYSIPTETLPGVKMMPL